MTRMFYTDDEAGRQQRRLDVLEAVADSLQVGFDAIRQANEPHFARYEARQDAKQEFYEFYGHWPTDEELDRSGIRI